MFGTTLFMQTAFYAHSKADQGYASCFCNAYRNTASGIHYPVETLRQLGVFIVNIVGARPGLGPCPLGEDACRKAEIGRGGASSPGGEGPSVAASMPV